MAPKRCIGDVAGSFDKGAKKMTKLYENANTVVTQLSTEYAVALDKVDLRSQNAFHYDETDKIMEKAEQIRHLFLDEFKKVAKTFKIDDDEIDELVDEFDDDMRDSVITLERQIDPDNFEDAYDVCFNFSTFFNNSLDYYQELKCKFEDKEQRPLVLWTDMTVHQKQAAIDVINENVSSPDEFIDELVSARSSGVLL